MNLFQNSFIGCKMRWGFIRFQAWFHLCSSFYTHLDIWGQSRAIFALNDHYIAKLTLWKLLLVPLLWIPIIEQRVHHHKRPKPAICGQWRVFGQNWNKVWTELRSMTLNDLWQIRADVGNQNPINGAHLLIDQADLWCGGSFLLGILLELVIAAFGTPKPLPPSP